MINNMLNFDNYNQVPVYEIYTISVCQIARKPFISMGTYSVGWRDDVTNLFLSGLWLVNDGYCLLLPAWSETLLLEWRGNGQ